jgi:predicted GIY-YIG superfamily endonuclease
VQATAGLRPLKLVFYSGFEDKYKAIEFEKYLKSGSGRAFTQKRLI